MGKRRLQAIADRGYFNGPEILACDEAGITPLVPKPMTSIAKAAGRFSKNDFIYIAKDDQYQCPAGERAIHRYTRLEDGLVVRCTGPARVHDAPSDISARPEITAISDAGSARKSLRRCSGAWIESHRR